MVGGTREAILEVVGQYVELESGALAELARGARLDEVTATDSVVVVELVLGLERRFGIRFPPDQIDMDLICDIDRLTAFVDAASGAAR